MKPKLIKLLLITLTSCLLANCATTKYSSLPPSKVEQQIRKETMDYAVVLSNLMDKPSEIGGITNSINIPRNLNIEDVPNIIKQGERIIHEVPNVLNFKRPTKYTKSLKIGAAYLADFQVRTATGKMKKTTRLSQMVKSARKYNNDVLAYNNNLKRSISRIRAMSSKEKRSEARAQKRAAQQTLKSVNKTLDKRIKDEEGVQAYSKKSSELKATIAQLKRRKKELEASIQELILLEGTQI